MKKISRVVLENFMSHKNTDVMFSDFTAIIGPTDNGKSALIKGIKKVLYNNPSGDDFVRKEYKIEYTTGADEDGNEIQVEVSRTPKPALTFKGWVYFDDGTNILRVKGPKENYYELTDNEGKTLHLEAFGVGPVKEVVDFHGMIEVNFFGDRQALNICGQFEPPFFLAETPATRAIMIGKLGNTEVVDLAIKNTASEIREANAEIKKHKAEIKDINAELKDLKILTKMGRDIDKIKKNIDLITELSQKINDINKATDGITKEKVKKAKLEYIVAMEDSINFALSKLSDAETAINRINDITKINARLIVERQKKDNIEAFLFKVDADKVNEIVDKIDTAVHYVNKALDINKTKSKIDIEINKKDKLEKLASGADDINKALENLTECQSLLDLQSKTTSALNKMAVEKDRKQKGDNIINNLEREYDLTVNKYKEGLLESPVCPMCASKITRDQIAAMKQIF